MPQEKAVNLGTALVLLATYWFKGVQLITVYAMIAILYYFLPAAKH